MLDPMRCQPWFSRLDVRNSRFCQCDIDGCGIEHRPGRDADDLNDEAVEVKRVVVHDDAPHVADDLYETSKNHENHETDLFPSDSKVNVNEHGDGVHDEEDNVGGEPRPILVHAPF